MGPDNISLRRKSVAEHIFHSSECGKHYLRQNLIHNSTMRFLLFRFVLYLVIFLLTMLCGFYSGLYYNMNIEYLMVIPVINFCVFDRLGIVWSVLYILIFILLSEVPWDFFIIATAVDMTKFYRYLWKGASI